MYIDEREKRTEITNKIECLNLNQLDKLIIYLLEILDIE